MDEVFQAANKQLLGEAQQQASPRYRGLDGGCRNRCDDNCLRLRDALKTDFLACFLAPTNCDMTLICFYGQCVTSERHSGETSER